MSRYKKDLGDFGEAVACHYLENKGYKILENNYRTRHGEIDIICMDKGFLVFVEVKTRKSNEYGQPAEAVNSTKIKHMKNAAKQYYNTHPIDAEIRFDVIEVYAANISGILEYSEINHIENIDVF